MKRGGEKCGAAGGSGRRPVKPSPLTAEDRAIWERLAGTIERLPPAKSRGRVPVSVTQVADPTDKPRAAPLVGRPARAGDAPALPVVNGRKRPDEAEPPPLAPFDRKRARAIVTGRLEIEAKLDLHGLRQDEAFHRLCHFLRDCATRGLSTVIVVTGKGGVRQSGREPAELGYAPPDRGVLRRNVPHWLDQPELRALVASFAPANIRHGGDGAFYIHLRKRR